MSALTASYIKDHCSKGSCFNTQSAENTKKYLRSISGISKSALVAYRQILPNAEFSASEISELSSKSGGHLLSAMLGGGCSDVLPGYREH